MGHLVQLSASDPATRENVARGTGGFAVSERGGFVTQPLVPVPVPVPVNRYSYSSSYHYSYSYRNRPLVAEGVEEGLEDRPLEVHGVVPRGAEGGDHQPVALRVVAHLRGGHQPVVRRAVHLAARWLGGRVGAWARRSKPRRAG
eukprot:1193077-Pyramimonas_sp.AAC.2